MEIEPEMGHALTTKAFDHHFIAASIADAAAASQFLKMWP
jgi:hypothetical protein